MARIFNLSKHHILPGFYNSMANNDVVSRRRGYPSIRKHFESLESLLLCEALVKSKFQLSFITQKSMPQVRANVARSLRKH